MKAVEAFSCQTLLDDSFLWLLNRHPSVSFHWQLQLEPSCAPTPAPPCPGSWPSWCWSRPSSTVSRKLCAKSIFLLPCQKSNEVKGKGGPWRPWGRSFNYLALFLLERKIHDSIFFWAKRQRTLLFCRLDSYDETAGGSESFFYHVMVEDHLSHWKWSPLHLRSGAVGSGKQKFGNSGLLGSRKSQKKLLAARGTIKQTLQKRALQDDDVLNSMHLFEIVKRVHSQACWWWSTLWTVNFSGIALSEDK